MTSDTWDKLLKKDTELVEKAKGFEPPDTIELDEVKPVKEVANMRDTFKKYDFVDIYVVNESTVHILSFEKSNLISVNECTIAKCGCITYRATGSCMHMGMLTVSSVGHITCKVDYVYTIGSGNRIKDYIGKLGVSTMFAAFKVSRSKNYDVFVHINDLNIDELLDHIYNGLTIKSLSKPLVSQVQEFKLKSKTPPAKPVEAKTEVKVTPVWKRVPPPTKFKVNTSTWDVLVCLVQQGKNILLEGPSGCGKSELAEEVALALGIPFEKFNMGDMSEPRLSLLGKTTFKKETGTQFEPSRFVSGIQKETGLILLDEITRAEKSAFNILMPLLDRQAYLSLDESEGSPIIKKSPKVSFIATANRGMEYTGTNEMDRALNSRFSVVIELGFPSAKDEADILMMRTGISADVANKLVDVAVNQRNAARSEEFSIQLSTRELLEAAYLISQGFNASIACKYGILNHFSGEGGLDSERSKLGQILQKKGWLYNE